MMETVIVVGVVMTVTIALYAAVAIVCAPRRIASDVMQQIVGDAPHIGNPE